VKTCLICKSQGEYPLCEKCSEKPFSVEKARQILASINDLNNLRKTYSLKYAEIKNLNSPSFWNKILSKVPELEKQDGMTKDRVRIAFSFLPKNAKRVLDIGAGNGFVEELLSHKDIKIYGNDISSVSIKNLNSKFVGIFRKESIYRMSYPKKYFDAVFALEVLEHIIPSKIFDLLRKVKQILKKDGNFIISVPTNEGLEKMKTNPSGHVRTYTENLIRSELRIAGFRVVKLKTLYAFKSYYTLKKISSNLFRRRWKPNNIVLLAKIA
jgi:2-polyprenyl-3-methyl-5-hydroxy-6-metoxy-1,4-benzoquinol methylase